MPARSSGLGEDASFVFQGTVQKLKATATEDVPASADTVTVRVDRVVQAPEALTAYQGRDVTVRLARKEKVAPGETFLFYTNGWIFGEGLAVQSVGLRPATPAAVAAESLQPED